MSLGGPRWSGAPVEGGILGRRPEETFHEFVLHGFSPRIPPSSGTSETGDLSPRQHREPPPIEPESFQIRVTPHCRTTRPIAEWPRPLLASGLGCRAFHVKHGGSLDSLEGTPHQCPAIPFHSSFVPNLWSTVTGAFIARLVNSPCSAAQYGLGVSTGKRYVRSIRLPARKISMSVDNGRLAWTPPEDICVAAHPAKLAEGLQRCPQGSLGSPVRCRMYPPLQPPGQRRPAAACDARPCPRTPALA